MFIIRSIKDYWYIPLIAISAFVGWILISRWTSQPSLPPIEKILTEVSAIKAKRKTREVQLRMGADNAKIYVRDQYAETLKRLDAEEKLKVMELENDPMALASYLDRLG